MNDPTPLHPANAEELANIAQETGADVLRGPLRYPSESGSWQLGDVDLGEFLTRYWDHEVVVIVASVGKAGEVEKEKYVCGICGFAIDELGECPRCKLQIEETARGIEARRDRKKLFREISEHLRGLEEEDDEA
jgi:hypothetical protein